MKKKRSSSRKKHMRKSTKRVKFNRHKRQNRGRNIRYNKMRGGFPEAYPPPTLRGGSSPNPFV